MLRLAGFVVLHHKLGSALVTYVKKRDDGGEIVQIIICHLLYIVVRERQGDAEENRAPAFHLFERHLLVAIDIFVVFLMPPSVMVNSVDSPTKAYLIFRIFATSA